MSALLAHAKALRALAEGFAQASEDCGDDANGYLLARISQAHVRAATALEQQARDEATGNGPVRLT